MASCGVFDQDDEMVSPLGNFCCHHFKLWWYVQRSRNGTSKQMQKRDDVCSSLMLFPRWEMMMVS